MICRGCLRTRPFRYDVICNLEVLTLVLTLLLVIETLYFYIRRLVQYETFDSIVLIQLTFLLGNLTNNVRVESDFS